MGSLWSSNSISRRTVLEPQEDIERQNISNSNTCSPGTRKRPNGACNNRVRHDNSITDSDDSIQVEYPRRKRRRTLATPLSFAADAFNSLSEKMSSVLANGFFLGVEFAARNGELADGEELFQSLVQLVDYFQSRDVRILRAGWRALYACTIYRLVTTEQGEEEEMPVGADTGCGNDISTVVAVMDRHPACIRVQLLGCRALKTLTIHQDDWLQLWEAGAISVFLKALENHPCDLIMQGLAVSFVAMLVQEKGESPRTQVLCEGGVPLILRAMRRFEDDPRLLHTGCYALHQLGFSRPSRALILQHGGIPTLLRSVERHLKDEPLVDLCLRALSKLSDEDSIHGHGVLPLVVRSMEYYPTEPAIQAHCLVLLLRSVSQETSSENIESSVRAILSAMNNFHDNSSVQFFACAGLREILEHTPRRQAVHMISSMGGLESVVKAAEHHRRVFGLQPMALLLLMNIWEQLRADHQPAAAAFGGSDRIVAILTGLQPLFAGDIAD